MSIEVFKKNHQLNITIADRDGHSKEYGAIVNMLANEEVQKSFNAKVSASELNAIKDFKLASLAKSLNINGFRPGKAPLSVVWKQYQESLTSEMINNTVNGVIDEINKIITANLITSPKVEVKNFSLEDGLEFDIILEMLPKFDLPDIKKISLNKPVYEIKAADINARVKELLTLRKNHVKAKESHKIAKGDQVVIDFEGKIDGVAFDGGAAKGHTLEIGSKSFIDNFEDQLIGHKIGDELLVKVTFPADYHEKKFASKPAEFAVTIHEIREVAEFKDEEELAKSIGFTSAEELHNKIKESLDKECANKVTVQMKVELFDKLDQICNFTTPQSMLDEEFNGLWKQVEEMRKNDAESDKSEVELRAEYLKIATRRVKLGILLTQIANNYDIKIEQQDFVDAIRAQIGTQSHPSVAQAVIQYYNNNPKAVEALRGPILEEKTVECILKDVISVEKSVDVKKLLEVEKD